MGDVSGAGAIEALRAELERQSAALIFLPETGSTMDVRIEDDVTKAVVLTDHQTNGRGRYDRDWIDTPGASILATYARSLSSAVMPRSGSLLLSHLFVLAVHDALGSKAVKIKWPNDLILNGRKLGGVLLTEDEGAEGRRVVRFGVGINLIARGTQAAASLDEVLEEPDRNRLVASINSRLDLALADLGRMQTPEVYRHYADSWDDAAWLLGKRIRVTAAQASDLEGIVTDSPLGGHLQLSLSNGGIMELKDYGHTAHIEVLDS